MRAGTQLGFMPAFNSKSPRKRLPLPPTDSAIIVSMPTELRHSVTGRRAFGLFLEHLLARVQDSGLDIRISTDASRRTSEAEFDRRVKDATDERADQVLQSLGEITPASLSLQVLQAEARTIRVAYIFDHATGVGSFATNAETTLGFAAIRIGLSDATSGDLLDTLSVEAIDATELDALALAVGKAAEWLFGAPSSDTRERPPG